ncbi:MAG: NUDIX hydrolase [Alcanivorax sp.]|nr:NUDIX hydrolase [Alcanivorax sp.]MBM1144647.1 NUDIX hydrolase [Alcanivorax sp. ZXX171]MCQ6261500.1 NUDIX hydrolase [Alcanivorax sp. MM125-6]MAY10062.1 NUDIX hydrolase [Alcanivorax sp.]MBI54216.1 NUDIX hydrolase [Alcanivorax sp.]|tara:strand:+ start:53958 stop:54524 length:567 start_codon:yes stop_codon:yes gene_type:complete
MKYCSHCGNEVLFSVPDGDNRPRYWCNHCGVIHYQNPKIVVGAVPVWEGRFLLCKRAIEPRIGYWTLPAGYMENGETLQEGAARETWEEACATVAIGDLYTVFNLPHINQVYMFFLGEMVNGDYGVGDESADAGLFTEDEIPWDELAFPTIGRTLKYYIQDRANGTDYPIRTQDIQPLKRKPSLDDAL